MIRKAVRRPRPSHPFPTLDLQGLEPRTLFSGPAATFDAPTFTPGAANFAIVLHLTDATPIATSGISPGNLQVVGPSGPLTVTGDQVTSLQNGQQVDVRYFVDAPNRIWDQRANGNYTISLLNQQIQDTSGIAASPASASLPVSLTAITQPLAAASEPSSVEVSTPGVTGTNLEVTYSDPAGIDLSTINSSNFDYLGTPLKTRVVSVASQDNGKVVHATYFLGAPRVRSSLRTTATTVCW